MQSGRKKSRDLVVSSLLGLGLSVLPGCGLSAFVKTEPDHVFSTPTPMAIERQAAAEASARAPLASYPDQASMTAGPEAMETPIQQVAWRPASLPATHAPAPRLNAALLPAMETVAASPLADVYPDEYLFDGGDREDTALIGSVAHSGLETEDTVAAWVSSSGQKKKTVANRVAVYAPRFGSVRRLEGLYADTQVHSAVGARDSSSVARLKTGTGLNEHVARTALVGLEFRNRTDGMMAAASSVGSNGRIRLEGATKVDQGIEGRNSSRTSSFVRQDGFVLAEGIRNAGVWSDGRFPMVSAATDSVSQLRDVQKLQQSVGLEDKNLEGVLKLVKLADVGDAQQGEIVQFTIRFENTGDTELRNVVIVDNLTPRLEYVDGSAEIEGDIDGFVTAEPNGEGSVVLKFQISGALPGHAHGEITFEALVR